MNLLLDTHVAVWAISDPGRIPDRIRLLMEREANDIAVSHVSLWEIAIKHQLGRPSAPTLPAKETAEHLLRAGFFLLPLDISHILAFERTPLLHGDPYDRLLIAQAASEGLSLLTQDSRLAAYGNFVINW